MYERDSTERNIRKMKLATKINFELSTIRFGRNAVFDGISGHRELRVSCVKRRAVLCPRNFNKTVTIITKGTA